MLRRLEYQAGHAIVWRDAVCNWFARTSGIPDAQNRVGNFPGRIEAEEMHLEGYTIFTMVPAEDASGGKGVECVAAARPCVATFNFGGAVGSYALDVRYFDQNNGASKFRVFAGNQLVAEWSANDDLPTTIPNADSSTRYRISGLALQPGIEIRIEGFPDKQEHAALDYIEIHPTAELEKR